MKSYTLCALVSFIGGIVVALLVILPLMIQGEHGSTEYVRVEKRIVYTESGKIEEAYFSYPSQEEFFKALSDASGYTIITEDLPKTPYSYSAKIGNWEDIIRFSAPYGTEAVPNGERSYLIRKIQK